MGWIRRRVAVGALQMVVALPATGQARDCVEDTIRRKSDDGSILVMMSGAVFEVLAGDTIDSSLWLALDDVLICEAPIVTRGKAFMIYDIINMSEHGKVGARRLH